MYIFIIKRRGLNIERSSFASCCNTETAVTIKRVHDEDTIYEFQNRFHWLAVVNPVSKLQFPYKMGIILTSYVTVRFHRFRYLCVISNNRQGSAGFCISHSSLDVKVSLVLFVQNLN
jgi:hypothetical protein